MDKKVVVHIHNRISLYYKKKNTFESILMRLMKPSEVSQKEKHQNSILMHIYGI